MSERNPDLAAELGRMTLFRGVAPDLLTRLVMASSWRRAQRNQRIYQQDDAPRAFFLVVSGHVRRAIASQEGDEKVIDIVSPGDCFGLAELFSGSPYVSFAEAVGPTLLLQVGSTTLLQAIEEDHALQQRVLSEVAGSKVSLERDLATYFFQSGARRLLDYLLREVGPRLAPTGDTVLELPVSKRLIAARLGVSAETLSRALRELSEAELIAVRGRTIILRDKLARRLAERKEEAELPLSAEQRNRRRADPWVERSSLSRPLGSRAWL